MGNHPDTTRSTQLSFFFFPQVHRITSPPRSKFIFQLVDRFYLSPTTTGTRLMPQLPMDCVCTGEWKFFGLWWFADNWTLFVTDQNPFRPMGSPSTPPQYQICLDVFEKHVGGVWNGRQALKPRRPTSCWSEAIALLVRS